MGVRIVADMKRHSPAVPTSVGIWGARGVPSGKLQSRAVETPRIQLMYDGTSGKEGIPAALAASDVWVDPTELQRQGSTQLGISAMYTGSGGAIVSGAMLPPDYAYRVGDADGAGLVTEASSKWEVIATLAPGINQNLFGADMVLYTLYKVAFTGGTPGNVTLVAL